MKHIKLFEELNEAKYKRAKFVSEPVKVDDVYFDHKNAKAGYYNYRQVKSIDGNMAEVAVVDTFNGQVRQKGSPYKVPLKDVQENMDKTAKERLEKAESENELVHNFLQDINFKKIKGGNLADKKVQEELKNNLKLLRDVAEKYREQDSSVPAGGFSGANSSTMRSSRSGTPISWEFNGTHRGGYYSGSTPFLVQIKVGGGLDYKVNSALVKVASNLLSKFNFESDLGSSRVTTTSGTNWSSAMLTAPSNGSHYTPIKSLNESKAVSIKKGDEVIENPNTEGFGNKGKTGVVISVNTDHDFTSYLVKFPGSKEQEYHDDEIIKK